MDEAMRAQALDYLMAFIVIAALVLGLGSMLLGRVVSWWEARGVNTSPGVAPIIMSRSEGSVPPSAPSSLETDGRRTETTAPGPKFTEDQLLTLYAGLRAHGMVRDKASQLLKASGIPMNNNLWTRAAPPPAPGAPVEDDDSVLTPIAGRRTRASYYPEEPDLEFNPPPR